MDHFKIKLKQAWDENPMQVIMVGASAATAGAMLINSVANIASRRTWAKEVKRRNRMTR